VSWVASAVAVGTAIYKGVEANQQDTIAKRQKPTNYIPPAATDNQKLAESQANATTYAGQSADEARNRQTISNAVGNVQRNARSATDILNTAANVEGGLGNQMANQVASRYQQFKQGALQRLMNANQNVAGYQNQDYQQTLNYKRQLEGAAMQNRFQAVNDIGGAGAQYANMKNFNNLYGRGGGGYNGYGNPPSIPRYYWNQGHIGDTYQPNETYG